MCVELTISWKTFENFRSLGVRIKRRAHLSKTELLEGGKLPRAGGVIAKPYDFLVTRNGLFCNFGPAFE